MKLPSIAIGFTAAVLFGLQATVCAATQPGAPVKLTLQRVGDLTPNLVPVEVGVRG